MKRLLSGLILGAIVLLVWQLARKGRLGTGAQRGSDTVNAAFQAIVHPSGAAQRNQLPSVSVSDQPYEGPTGSPDTFRNDVAGLGQDSVSEQALTSGTAPGSPFAWLLQGGPGPGSVTANTVLAGPGLSSGTYQSSRPSPGDAAYLDFNSWNDMFRNSQN